MADLIIPARKVVLAAMKADAGLTAIVPAARIYPMTTPAEPIFPFIRWDGPSSIPISGACIDGAEVRFMIHAFAKPRYNGSRKMLETAEDHAGRIAAAISGAIDRRRFVSAGRSFRVRCLSTVLRRDGAEADAFHATVNAIARAL